MQLDLVFDIYSAQYESFVKDIDLKGKNVCDQMQSINGVIGKQS